MTFHPTQIPSTRLVALVGILAALCAAVAPSAADELEMPALAEGPNATVPDNPSPSGIASSRVGAGAVRFVDLRTNAPVPPVDRVWSVEQARARLDRSGGLFGVGSSRLELELTDILMSPTGGTRYEYRQIYEGVPVFAGLLRLHVDRRGEATAMSGLFVSDIDVDVQPTVEPLEADRAAIAAVAERLGHTPAPALFAAPTTELQVLRAGLLRGHPDGLTYLAYFVEVTNHADVREFVHVDAHTGKILQRIPGIARDLHRVVYDGYRGGFDPDRPDLNVLREEGDPPTGVVDVDEIYGASGDTHGLFLNAFGYDSYDGAGHPMRAIAFLRDRNAVCPNASWNGTVASFCEDVWSDDVVAHEWAHAYTEYTHGLFYVWQSGALNEAYSDIFGHTVDLLNEGCELQDRSCAPMSRRTDSFCSADAGSPPPIVRVFEPSSIAGDYRAVGATFGSQVAELGSITGTIVAAEDGGGDIFDACGTLTNADELEGNIALVNRGDCFFIEKAAAVEAAGAIAVIVVNIEADEIFTMGSAPDESADIPAVMIGRSAGTAIREVLEEGVSATIQVAMGGLEESSRWLIGSVERGTGVLRDMWNPICFGHPGRVGDDSYFCGTDDWGGVHLNSGVPNHTYALLVDGGVYNGQLVEGIGLTKAAHIYWVSMSAYQMPATDFVHHADSLEAACADLVDAGTVLPDLVTGEPTGQVVAAADCETLSRAIAATELRDPPPCEFQPVLQADAPRICPGGSIQPAFEDGFDESPQDIWTFSHEGEESEYRETDWAWVDSLPAGREGSAMFARSSVEVGDCQDDDQSGVVRMTSPVITLPDDEELVYLVFDHYVATEPVFDGGNLAASVNGGDFDLIEAEAFAFNPYNEVLTEGRDNTNPLEGQDAFTGIDEGTLRGSWGQSQIRLTDIASPGDEVQIQFRMGVDGCNGIDGWYVDDVLVAHCGPCLADEDCDDSNDCTTDVCALDTGVCANDPVEPSTACGDPTDSACTLPDTCDGEGVCQANDVDAGTACGMADDSECDSPDGCDGEGACAANHAPAGTPCGDVSATACDRPDICDASGLCSENLAPPRTLCGDRADTDCTAPDTCDVAGVCHINDAEDGLACSSGSACLVAGLCERGLCAGEDVLVCDDDDPCTLDVCDEETGCLSTLIEDCGGSSAEDMGIDLNFPELDDQQPTVAPVATPESLADVGCCRVAPQRRQSRALSVVFALLLGIVVLLRRQRPL